MATLAPGTRNRFSPVHIDSTRLLPSICQVIFRALAQQKEESPDFPRGEFNVQVIQTDIQAKAYEEWKLNRCIG
jgi:hypothetical protein